MPTARSRASRLRLHPARFGNRNDCRVDNGSWETIPVIATITVADNLGNKETRKYRLKLRR